MSCRLPGITVLILALWGCAPDGPTAPLGDRPHEAVGMLLGCLPQSGLAFTQWWGCNEHVVIGTDGNVDSGTVDGAIQAWRTALHWDELGSVPHLFYRSSSPNILVSRASGSIDQLYCGNNDPTSSITLYGTDQECMSQRLGDAYAVLVHELGEVLGLHDGLEGGTATLGALDCTIRTKNVTRLNSTPCAQEVEYIFAGYGLTTVDVNNIWNQTVVTGLALAAHDLTVEKDHSVTDSVSSIRVDPPGTSPSSAPPTQATYSWVSANQSVALVTPSAGGRTASIKGVNAGTTYIRVTATGTSVSNGIVGTLVKRLGDSVKVVVPTPPPAGTYFRVSDITGPPVPITNAGGEELHAVVQDPYSPDYEVGWYITYSNGSHATISSPYTSSSNYSLPVPAGSYRITVTATARSSGHYQSHTSYFPVCTGSGGGGGGDLLRAPLPDSLAGSGSDTSAGTDAVGGC